MRGSRRKLVDSLLVTIRLLRRHNPIYEQHVSRHRLASLWQCYDIIPYVALQRSRCFGRRSRPAHTVALVLCRLADTLVPPLRSGLR
jgi:hypothetical protein